MPQAEAFREECAELDDLLLQLAEEDFELRTQFKDWSINDILRHLHVWNLAAGLSLRDSAAFLEFCAPVPKFYAKDDLRTFEKGHVGGLRGTELCKRWRSTYMEVTEQFALADPRQRLKWGGPDLSTRSCITSRQMEVWAHGQAIYDEFGIPRKGTDRLRNVAELGVRTFSWTFKNRGMAVPGPLPEVSLTAPSGEIWRWPGERSGSSVSGSALEFCQVVTQVRNVADTQLDIRGSVAKQWMSLAQCFAGLPQDPPAPHVRHVRLRRLAARELSNG